MHGNNRTTAPEPYAPNGMRCLPVSKFTRFRFSAQTPRPPFPTDSENKDRKIKFKTKMPCRLFDRFRTERRRDRPDKTAGKGQAFRYATLVAELSDGPSRNGALRRGRFSAARVLYEKPLANTVSSFDRQFSRRNAKSRKPGKSEVCGFTP